MAPARPLFKTYSLQSVQQFADGTLSAVFPGGVCVCESHFLLDLILSLPYLFILGLTRSLSLFRFWNFLIIIILSLCFSSLSF